MRAWRWLAAVALLAACSGTRAPLGAPAGDGGDAARDPDAAASDLAVDAAPDLAADTAPDLVLPEPPPDGGAADREEPGDVAPGVLALEPGSHEFLPTVLGGRDAFTFTVRNLGGSPLPRPSLFVAGAAFVLPDAANRCARLDELAAGGGCTVEVQFRPESRGIKTGTVMASASGQTVTATLSGAGQSPPGVVISPTQANFVGVVGRTGPSIRLIVGNIGDVATGGLSVRLVGTDADDFVVATNGCPAPLASLSTCEVALAFRPRSVGMKSATLAVMSIPGGVALCALTGTAQPAPVLTITPPLLDFGPVAVGTTSAPIAVDVKNTGGAASAPLTVTVSTTEFMVTANACTGVVLPPGRTCALSVVFRPVTVGAKSAALTVSDGGATTAAQVTGTATL